MTTMSNQSHVGTPPDFSCRTGAVTGFERGFGGRAAVGDGADAPSTRGIVATRFVGSAGGFGVVGTVTGATRASWGGGEGAAWAAASGAGADVEAGVPAEGPATAAGADRGALATGAAVEGWTAGATLGTEAAGVGAPTLGGGCATSA